MTRVISNSFFVAFLIGVSMLVPYAVQAEDLESQSYKILAPSVVSGGGYASSSSFTLFSVIAEFAQGTTSSSTFGIHAGFAAYPFVSTPTVSATAGSSQVALSWTAAQGYMGWVVSGYDVGQSTASGGPYTYTAVGNVTSSTRTSLSNGTTYYFVVVPKDSFGNRIATSTQVSGTPVAAASTPAPAVSGGGGGNVSVGPIVTETGAKVILNGRAYPGSTVTILKDSILQSRVPVQESADFTSTISGLQNGSYLFSVYAQDINGNQSSMVSIPVSVVAGVTTTVNGIFLAPTIDTDKVQVKKGSPIRVFGQSSPNSTIAITVNSDTELFFQTPSDAYGVYSYSFLTNPLELGNHSTYTNASKSGEVSSASKKVAFTVGLQDVLRAAGDKPKNVLRADFNKDGRVSLVDFSIIAYWYKKRGFPTAYDLNGDGMISLVDLSIMASHWTG